MRIVSLFNNKGGVGKSTLAFHLSNILSEMGKKTLMIDLDPQCNLTIMGCDEERLHDIWIEEDPFIEDFEGAVAKMGKSDFEECLKKPKTIHFLLKPTEDGQGDLELLPPPINVRINLDLIPGRLTIHQYESKISERWSGAYLGESLSIRSITKIRAIAEEYSRVHGYDFVIIDTSPSLGALNKVIISTVDGFIIPALPDMFSMYGIRNIGSALGQWNKEFTTIYRLISDEKRKKFPKNFVRFLGYTIYNAKKYGTSTDEGNWNLAQAHLNYARAIPDVIMKYIGPELRDHLPNDTVNEPIGGVSVMHTHNTLPNMAQKYKVPIWLVPIEGDLDDVDKSTIMGNRARYEETQKKYEEFALSFLQRVESLEDSH